MVPKLNARALPFSLFLAIFLSFPQTESSLTGLSKTVISYFNNSEIQTLDTVTSNVLCPEEVSVIITLVANTCRSTVELLSLDQCAS